MNAIKAFVMAVTLGSAGIVGGCAPLYQNHGYVPADDELSQIRIGQTRRDDLDALIGRPSAQGVLTGSGWYYVGSRWEHYGPLRPKEIKREVVAISFAPNGAVSNIERFGLDQGQVITLSRRVTDTSGASLGFVRQLLGSIGRVSAGDVLKP